MGTPAGALPSTAAPHQPPFAPPGELVASVADGGRVGGASWSGRARPPGVSRVDLRAATGFEPAVAGDMSTW